jgi:lipopolysaccharide/colanic/teichoic acid biosynthesis glycosyltransferase
MSITRVFNSIFSRTIDIFGSIVGIIILSPLLAAAAVAIKLDSRGPIIFRQKRVGKGGEIITIHKFRTMSIGSDFIALGRTRARYDGRVTRVGALLRRTSIDELPQLFDVLLGSLALVGPRPILPYEAKALEEHSPKVSESLRERLEFKPGITGWAQVNGLRGGTGRIDSFERMIEFDLEYMRRRTIGSDLWILCRTIVYPVAHENAW